MKLIMQYTKSLILFSILMSTFSYSNGQLPHFVKDLTPFIEVYDSNEFQQFRTNGKFVTGVISRNENTSLGIDTISIGLFSTDGKRFTDYDLSSKFLFGRLVPEPLADGWLFHINSMDPQGGQSPGGKYYLTDKLMNIIDTFQFNLQIPHYYKGDTILTDVWLDNHSQGAFYHQGELYYLTIGFRTMLVDATKWNIPSNDPAASNDSLLGVATSLHVMDKNGNEVGRWDPMTDSTYLNAFLKKEHFEDMTFLRTNPNPQDSSEVYVFTFPHINRTHLKKTNTGVDVYWSGRAPGNVGKLTWKEGGGLDLDWVFGASPKPGSNIPYLTTISSVPLDGNHGCAPFQKDDTTFFATYNNRSLEDSSSRAQVYKKVKNDDTVRLVWQSPDIGFHSRALGHTHWIGNRIMFFRGDVPETAPFPNCEIWNPWNDTRILSIQPPGSTGDISWVKSHFLPEFQKIKVKPESDSIQLYHPSSWPIYWNVADSNLIKEKIYLPSTYIDSLDQVSAWLHPAQHFRGVWKVSNKDIVTGSKFQKEPAPDLILYPNPSDEQVFITENITSTWELFNREGDKLKEDKGKRIDVSGLPPGLYFVRVNGNVKKIIVE